MFNILLGILPPNLIESVLMVIFQGKLKEMIEMPHLHENYFRRKIVIPIKTTMSLIII